MSKLDVATRERSAASLPVKSAIRLKAGIRRKGILRDTLHDGRVMIFAGGIPLKRDGKAVGAIGVSGGSGEQDQAVEEAGAAAFK